MGLLDDIKEYFFGTDDAGFDFEESDGAGLDVADPDDPNDERNYESSEGLRGGWDIENSEDYDDDFYD